MVSYISPSVCFIDCTLKFPLFLFPEVSAYSIFISLFQSKKGDDDDDEEDEDEIPKTKEKSNIESSKLTGFGLQDTADQDKFLRLMGAKKVKAWDKSVFIKRSASCMYLRNLQFFKL